MPLTSQEPNIIKNRKSRNFVFYFFHNFSDRQVPVPPHYPGSMIWAGRVPATGGRESDRKSIVFPSSEGVEWAAGARVHYFNVPGTRGEEIFALRPL